MGRPRSFDIDIAVSAARAAFVRGGYAGTSVEDLLTATGVQRASLYSAFGSKRGLFVAALQQADGDEVDLDLLLVALMDLASTDDEIAAIAAGALGRSPDLPEALGRRLLQRAGLGGALERKDGQ